MFFFKIFVRHISIFGPLIPLFPTSGDVSSGFQSQSGQHSSNFAETYVIYVHLWCDTSVGVYGQHSNWSLYPHACFRRGRMLDLNHRPPAWQEALTTRPQRPGFRVNGLNFHVLSLSRTGSLGSLQADPQVPFTPRESECDTEIFR